MVLGDRILVMRNGAIAQVGSPRDIYFAPANRFVAEFIGSANIFDAECRDGHARTAGRTAKVENSLAGPVVAMIRAGGAGDRLAGTRAIARSGRRGEFCRRPPACHGQRRGESPLLIDAPNTRSIRIGETVGIEADPAAIRFVAEDTRP